MKVIGIVVISIVAFMVLVIGFQVIGYGCRSANVALQQVDPAELLRKYEWFKNASAQLDAKFANAQVYQSRTQAITTRYASGQPMTRTDAESLNQISAETAGLVASYNLLAADYNAQMAKINWAFCNIGTLPKGADKVLPREYRTYETQIP